MSVMKGKEFEGVVWVTAADCQAEIARLQRENDELRARLDFYTSPVNAVRNNALKAQSTEPVAKVIVSTRENGLIFQFDLAGERQQAFDLADGEHLLYTTPPTATALVEDFKRKIVWMLDTITADVRFQSKDCYRMADQLRHDIESLPLIEEQTK